MLEVFSKFAVAGGLRVFQNISGVVDMKKIKVMAYVMSSGLWDSLGPVSLEKTLGFKDPELENDLNTWHASYDDQFKRYPYDFDWAAFNKTGKELTARIKVHLPPDVQIVYEPSDDREFFSEEDCKYSHSHACTRQRELSLRERKRSLLYQTPLQSMP